ncbi:MAG: acyltransferase [Clostridiales bacterium]|nr:acyltransferase [Clostridiales bacterium]
MKTVLMLSVVICHSVLFWGGGWFTADPAEKSVLLSGIAAWLNSFHIFGFTLVSGYLFYYIKYERGQYERFLPFVVNKAKRLIVPYIFVSVIWAAPFQYAFFRYDAITLIKNFGLGIGPNQLWFLLMLFGVFLVFWLLSNFMKKHSFIGMLTVIGLYGISIVGRRLVPNVFRIWEICSFMPLFWLGFKFRQYGTDWGKKVPAILWVAGDMALFAVFSFSNAQEGWFFDVVSSASRFALYIVGAAMSFFVLQKMAVRIKWDHPYFRFFSKSSMIIYLFHQQIIYFFIYWLNGAVNPYLNAGINFTGSMILSSVIATILLRFKVTRFLVGEKP